MSGAPHAAKTRGRNVLQARQRDITRTRLIAAARTLFERNGYAAVIVEAILAEAGVSRATFYAQFESKLALVEAIAADFLPVWQPLYDELAAMPDPSLADLEAWAARHVAIYREHQQTCIILTQVAAVEERFYWHLADTQSALIDQLGKSVPAFKAARTNPEARIRAALTLSQIDQACYFLAVRRWDADITLGVRVMARQLQHFYEDSLGCGTR